MSQEMVVGPDKREQQPSYSYVAGCIGALLGALVGAVPWVIVGQLGFQASILGALIGSAAMFGYTRFGGKLGRATAWIIALSTLLGVVAAELTSTAIFFKSNDYAISLYNYRIMYTDPEVARGSWTSLIVGLAMAGLGVWRIIAKLARAARPEVPAAPVASEQTEQAEQA
jgi:MFS family permease